VDDLAEARAALGERLRLLGLRVTAVADGPAQIGESFADSRPIDVTKENWKPGAPFWKRGNTPARC
jgi:hypothetical protein